MSKRLVVMSVDSLFTSDLEKVKDKVGFAEVLSDCIVIPNLTCIYPTLTYPCHTTMITGRYPASHGIIHNENTNIIRYCQKEWIDDGCIKLASNSKWSDRPLHSRNLDFNL